MLKALSIDYHKSITSLGFNGLLFLLMARGISRSPPSRTCSESERGASNLCGGSVLSTDLGPPKSSNASRENWSCAPGPSSVTGRRGLASLPFQLPGPEQCQNWTPPMDEPTSPEVQKNWVLPLPPYMELPYHLQFLPTSFELVEPLHTS